MTSITELKTNKRLYLRDWEYSDKDIPITQVIPSPTRLKEFKNFTEDDKLSILNDRVFKAMFYDDKRLKHSAMIISQFINISYEEALKNIRLLKNVININSAKSRMFIADFVAEVYNNIINMEMNVTDQTERNIIYLEKLCDRKNKKGEELEVPDAGFQINFCDYGYKGFDKCFDLFKIQNESRNLLTFSKQFVMIFLQNIWKKYYNNIELTYKERIILVHVATNVSVAKDIAQGDEYLMEIIKDLKELETNSDLIEAYDHEVAYGESCRIQGEKSTLMKVLKNMLKNGRDYNEISDTLELPISEIKEYVKELNKIG